ncbi:DUF2141 domain-containing protein [Novosphingobium sp.]|uniref:DUF2141 domain-containing protein n=1 Tax=Novosphingobium sp. TaxID=1874826 RepID=UPI003B522478
MIWRAFIIAGLVIPQIARAEEGAPAPATATAAAAAITVIVTITIAGLRNTHGNILACLTTRPATFPDCDKDPQSLRLTVPARNGPALVFRHVVPGIYAVSLFHDENANGRLDKTMGIPSEGYGFSRDAAILFGPPKFDAAKVAVGAADIVLPVKIRYIL